MKTSSPTRDRWTTANSVRVVGEPSPPSSRSTEMTLDLPTDPISSSSLSFDKYRCDAVTDSVLMSAAEVALVPASELRELRCKPELTSSMLGSKETSSIER